MKVLILGANGMLGHKVYQACRERFDTLVAMRRGCDQWKRLGVDVARVLREDVAHNGFSRMSLALLGTGPAVVVNCIGLVKQKRESDKAAMFGVNGVFPHSVAAECHARGARLIHISTDCVFSGNNGTYTEDDTPDPVNVYGWSKLLGEVTAPGCLTLRTSIIGRELATQRGLLEWLISQRGGEVQGWANAIFSGLTTNCLAGVIADVMEHHPTLHGLYHVSGEPISKFDLLHLLNESFDLGVEITPDDSVVCNRSLGSGRFRAATNWSPPSWEDMIEDMRSDPTPYDEWRKQCLTESV